MLNSLLDVPVLNVFSLYYFYQVISRDYVDEADLSSRLEKLFKVDGNN